LNTEFADGQQESYVGPMKEINSRKEVVEIEVEPLPSADNNESQNLLDSNPSGTETAEETSRVDGLIQPESRSSSLSQHDSGSAPSLDSMVAEPEEGDKRNEHQNIKARNINNLFYLS
jgi:hypothetical protein